MAPMAVKIAMKIASLWLQADGNAFVFIRRVVSDLNSLLNQLWGLGTVRCTSKKFPPLTLWHDLWGALASVESKGLLC